MSKWCFAMEGYKDSQGHVCNWIAFEWHFSTLQLDSLLLKKFFYLFLLIKCLSYIHGGDLHNVMNKFYIIFWHDRWLLHLAGANLNYHEKCAYIYSKVVMLSQKTTYHAQSLMVIIRYCSSSWRRDLSLFSNWSRLSTTEICERYVPTSRSGRRRTRASPRKKGQQVSPTATLLDRNIQLLKVWKIMIDDS